MEWRFMKQRLLLVLGLLTLSVCGVALYIGYVGVTNRVSNAYAVDWVSAMVVEHMHVNDGRWPSSWQELRPVYDNLEGAHVWSFTELQQRVAVDWKADPAKLKRMADAQQELQVIWLLDGTNAHWEGSEPNGRVAEYLRTGRRAYLPIADM